ncbi:MAG: hypothetical protein LBU77_02755 [Clostridiales bacterium]|jgi:multisubunit Na+/H+ antiporter MnhG subunit|nr:hypothetical protein [Clostridiales bacterium]
MRATVMEMLEKLDIIITLFAALTVAAVSVYSGADLNGLAYSLVLTIVVFYIIGVFIKHYIMKTLGQGQAKAGASQIKADGEQKTTETGGAEDRKLSP